MSDVITLEQQVFTVQQFCLRNGISTSTWYKLRRQGRGPRVIKLGHVTRISIEAERDWRVAMEREAAGEAAQLEHARRRAHNSELGKLALKSPGHPANKRRNSAKGR
jgi:predicted DNA-binding transcriptional regulator AlpA